MAFYVWILLISLFDGSSPRSIGLEANRFRELLLIIPFFGLIAISGRARLILQAYVVGCLVLAFMQWGTLVSDRLFAALEAKRITNGFLLACGAYLAAWLAINCSEKSQRLIWAACAIFIAFTTLLVVRGRTGHLTIAMLAVLFALQFSQGKWRIILVGLLAIALAFAALFAKPVQQRLNEQNSELLDYSSGKNIVTSTGIRLELIHNTWAMIKNEGVLGIGYGNFENHYKQFAQTKYLADPKLKQFADAKELYPSHPHNEFLYHWICGGIMSLLLFFTWLAWPVYTAIKKPSTQNKATAALALAMSLGCALNVFLLNFPEGHAYIFLMATLYALSSSSEEKVSS